MKRYVSGLLSTLLLGCLVIFQPAKAQTQKNGATVCLMSSVGQKFELKKIGIMVFGNDERVIPIADWKIDEKVYQKIKTILGSRFTVKKIDIPAETLKNAFDETFGVFRDLRAHRREVLGNLVDSAKCTYLLTITPGGSKYGSSNQFVRGVGVVDAEGLVSDSRRLYALSYLQFFDARTMERIDRTPGGTDEDTLFSTIKGPYKDIEAGAEPPAEAFAADPETRKIVWAFLEHSLELSVPGLFKLETLESKTKKASEQKSRWVSPASDSWPRF